LHQIFHTESKTHPNSESIGMFACFPRKKSTTRVYQAPPSSARTKKATEIPALLN